MVPVWLDRQWNRLAIIQTLFLSVNQWIDLLFPLQTNLAGCLTIEADNEGYLNIKTTSRGRNMTRESIVQADTIRTSVF